MTSLEGLVDSSISDDHRRNLQEEQIMRASMAFDRKLQASKRSKAKKIKSPRYEKRSAIEETQEYTGSNRKHHQRHPTHTHESHTLGTRWTSRLEDQEPDKWCIYRVPGKLRKANEAAYTPQLLSIGPFHHGKPELTDMETYKKMYCANFRERCKKSADDLKRFIEGHQKNIFRCYAGTIELDADPVDVILVDACFIIQLFLLNFENVGTDYILRSEWLRKAVEHELILFENQLPYSFLEALYDFSMTASSSVRPLKESQEQKVEGNGSSGDDQQYSLLCSCWTHPHDHTISVDRNVEGAEPVHNFLKLTCEFFKDYSQGKSIRNGVKPKHFTDLVRHFLCPEENMICVRNRPEENMICVRNPDPVKSIYDVRKLTAAGVKFRPLKGTVRFVIKRDHDEAHKCKFNLPCFRNMKLKLTQFCVKYETECLIRNVMALEQILYPQEPYICSYFLLMDQLVDTVEDVNLLVEKQIIVNLLGSNKAVMKLVNSLCEQIKEDKTFYSGLCVELNAHYEISKVNRSVANLKRVYFKDLWTSSSTVLGVVVLLFSVVGTIKSLMS